MRSSTFALVLVVTTLLPACLLAEDAPKRSPELQVLDRFIGEWDGEAVVKGTGEKTKSVEHRKWSRAGKFVLSENWDESAQNKRESHFLMSFDSKTNQYRSCFINEEFTVPLLGTWDETSKTMRWKSSDVPFKHDVIDRFVDKDHVEWTMKVVSPEGDVVLEIIGKQTRRASDPGKR